MASRTEWYKTLRQTIKLEVGVGWSVRGRGEKEVQKTQVQFTYQDGLGKKNPRNYVVLPYDWSSRNQSQIITAVAELRRLITERSCTLVEAEKFRLEPIAHDKKGNINSLKAWKNMVDAFLEQRSNRRETTLKDLRTRLRRFLETMEKSPKPRNWEELLNRYAVMHFDGCPPGGQGRKRQIVDVVAFLRFAVEMGAPKDRWEPPSSDSNKMKALKKKLIGKSQPRNPTVPLKGEDLEMLLEALKQNEKHGLRMAVGLIGLFGLRPSELAVLRVEDGKLYVGHVKNNENTIGEQKLEDRRVIALDLPSLPGEGARLVRQYEAGLVKFPLSLSNAIKRANLKGEYKDVGDALRQLLQRYWMWKQLSKKIDGLKVYSLRHSFAWRSVKESKTPLTIRDASKFMGHDARTHLRHYGQWVDEASLEAAAERYKAGQEVAA